MSNSDDVMSKKPESGAASAPPAPAPAPGVGAGAGAGAARRSAAPPRQPWTAEVDVYLTKGCPDPEFEIRTSLPFDPATKNITFHNNRRPGFNIRFNLHDETGSNPPYIFPPQPRVREACWSLRGGDCPNEPVWEVFNPRRVLNHGETLEVYNENPDPALGPFQYALRVTNDGGANFCDLDPPGDDQNGPSN